MNPNQFTGLFNYDSGGSIGYRKNSVSGFDAIITDIFLEPVRDFLRQEGDLRLFSAFWIPNDSLPVFDILGCEFENLADTHAAPCHKFEHQAVSWTPGPEDDLIDYVFFNNFELGWLPCPEKLSEGRIITRIFKIGLNRIFDVIEKGSQKCES